MAKTVLLAIYRLVLATYSNNGNKSLPAQQVEPKQQK